MLTVALYYHALFLGRHVVELEFLFLCIAGRLGLNLRRYLLEVLVPELHRLHLEIILVLPCDLRGLVRVLRRLWPMRLLLQHFTKLLLSCLMPSGLARRVISCLSATERVLLPFARALHRRGGHLPTDLLVALAPIEYEGLVIHVIVGRSTGRAWLLRRG